MPDKEASEAEEKRIQEWREERARQAEADKLERIEKKKAERELKKKEELLERQNAARQLAPSEQSLNETSERILRYHRRQRQSFILQFVLLVAIPFALFAYYLYAIATPLYESRAVIAITKPSAEQEANAGGLLGSLGGPSNMQEVFMAHEFVESEALVSQLQEDLGLVSYLSSEEIDPVRKLRAFPLSTFTLGQQFGRFVDSSVNIQSGLLTLYVRMPDPDKSVEVQAAILERTAERVNGLSSEVFNYRVSLAEAAVSEAEGLLEEAQNALVAIQIESGEADPTQRIEGIYATIRGLLAEEQGLTSEIEKARTSLNVQGYEVDRLTELRDNIRIRIEAQRDLLISEPEGGGPSLNNLLMQYTMAKLGVQIAEQRLTTSLEGISSARQSAALSQSIFQVIVPPTPAESPTYPSVISNLFVALLALLGFFGLFRLLLPKKQLF